MNTYQSKFSDWLRNEDKSESTIRTYLSVLERFTVWFEETDGEPFDPKKITTLTLLDYRSYQQNVLEMKPTTINKSIATLKTFFGWLADQGHIENNVASKVKMKRVQNNGDIRWLDDNQLNRLMYSLETEKNDLKRSRDNLTVLLMVKGGLRIEEVSNVKKSHMDLKEDIISVVNGKGGKYRIIPLHNEIKKAAKRWLQLRNEIVDPVISDSDYLLVSERSPQLSVRAISYRIDNYMDRCGLKEGGYSAHSLRHTFCKNLVNSGVPIQNVAKLAGHDSIQTTMRYVEASQNDLKKAIQSI